MERLEAKRIHGHVYYYYSKWARKDGRCRRVWQRYLGKLEDIVQAVEAARNRHTQKCFNSACLKRFGENPNTRTWSPW